MGETSAKSVICAFGVAALAGRPPFARAFAGTGDCSEFANIWNSVRNFQNSFFWTVCVRAIRVWKGGPTGAAESLLSGFMIRVVKNQTSRFHFFRSPKAFVGSTQFEQEQSGGPRGTVRPHTLDAPTTRLVCALQGTWAWRGRSVVDVGRRCGRSVSVLFDPPRPRPGTRVLARVRVRGVVPPGQNRPTATLAAQSGHTHLMLQPRGSSALCRGLGRGGGAVSSTSGGVAAGRFQFFSTRRDRDLVPGCSLAFAFAALCRRGRTGPLPRWRARCR